MKKKDLLILLFVSILYSCSFSSKRENREFGKSITIEAIGNSKIKFSDLFDQVDYVPLETTDSSLVGIVERFRIFDYKVCLLCDKSLLLFDAYNGQSIFKISKLGNAPGEYKSLYDVFINKEGDIELLDMNERKIHQYDEDGVFKKSFGLPSMSFSFLKNGENDYWLYNNNMVFKNIKSKVVHYDTSRGEVKDSFFPIDMHLANFLFVVEGNNFVKRKEDLLFFSCPPDKVYSLKEGMEPTVTYSLDWGTHAIPNDFYKRNYSDIMEFSTEANKREYVYFVNNFAANDAYVQFSFFLNKIAYWSIYSEYNETNYVGCILQDDLNFLGDFQIDNLNTLYVMDENYLYFLLSAEQFIEISDKSDVFFELINKNNISEQSNPLLVKCRFKKNL